MCIQFNKKLRDHAATDMYKRPVLLSRDVTEYAPIVDCDTALKVKREFNIAYLIAKHKLAFTKMGPLCELEERHEVELEQGYKNDQGCATFR